MWAMVWPVLVVLGSNIVYNICQKSTPEGVNPFGAVMITYIVAAVVCAVLFFATAGFSGAAAELKKLNWTSIILGIAIIGLEAGYLFLYRAGWKVSVGSVVCNIALAVALLLVGFLLYKEKISLRQIAGIAVCAAGLVLVSK
ncbi:MAG: EamA family transporter [Clostridia bacterium]|nr:EamA family transporter [Clostridia bacterium]